MIAFFVAAQAGDLLSLLLALHLHPELAPYEIGPIGALWLAYGVPAAVAYKVVLAAFVLMVARWLRNDHPRYSNFLLVTGGIAGTVGIFANLSALVAVS